MSIVAHKVYPEMYYAKFEDGTLSADFYNKSRAKEHSKTFLEIERLANHYKQVVKPALQPHQCV